MELVVFLLEQALVFEGQALDLPNLAIDPISDWPSLTRPNLTHRGYVYSTLDTYSSFRERASWTSWSDPY